jgi:hypothetical protein
MLLLLDIGLNDWLEVAQQVDHAVLLLNSRVDKIIKRNGFARRNCGHRLDWPQRRDAGTSVLTCNEPDRKHLKECPAKPGNWPQHKHTETSLNPGQGPECGNYTVLPPELNEISRRINTDSW